MAGSIYDEPNVGLNAVDFDIGFIGDKCHPYALGILIDEWFDADGHGFTVGSEGI